MRAFIFLLGFVTATILLAPTYSLAAGSGMHTPLLHATAAVTLSEISTSPRCGTHRYYDPKNTKVLWPGEFLKLPHQWRTSFIPGAPRALFRPKSTESFCTTAEN
jgi:hypothetical protein